MSKIYKRVVEWPQEGAARRWSPEGGAGWYVVQEREETGQPVYTPLAGSFKTRAEAEAHLVGPIATC